MKKAEKMKWRYSSPEEVREKKESPKLLWSFGRGITISLSMLGSAERLFETE
jgi:hypothetical protein